MKPEIRTQIPFGIRHLSRLVKWVYVFICMVSLLLASHNFAFADDAHPAAIDSLKLLMKKSLKTQDKISTLTALGKAYYNESDFDNALKTTDQLLETIQFYGTKVDSAKCFRLIGLIYLQKSWYDKSLESMQLAQQLFGESGDSSKQAKALMNIGIIHDYMGNLPMALLYYERALNYFEHKKEQNGMADCQLNIAIVLSKQRKYEQACNTLVSAAGIYEKAGNFLSLAIANINLGLTYKKMGNYPLAIEYLNKAFDTWKQEGDEVHICDYYMNMGEIMLDMKKTDEAGIYLRQAEKLALTLGSMDMLATVYEYLSDYNAARKNYVDAYTYLNKSKQINDSIRNAETTDKISHIQYQYEIAKRESYNNKLVKQNLNSKLQIQEKNMFLHILTAILVIIAILVLFLVNQNQIKRKANQQLEAKSKLIETQKDELLSLNASKDKFLSIMAHDIKNPLSSILGLSDMLVNDQDSLTNDEKMIFTRDIHTLSSNLFEIINTLLAWSTSQSGMIAYRPKPFLISDLCRQSVRNLQTVAKQKDILLVCKADEKLSVMADENMILSVMHNLINNAIKYSHPGTSIHVETKLLEQFVQISVIDSGIGLSPENLEKLFKYDQHFLNKGTAGEAGTGLGLILCKDFVDKNGGTISVESKPEKGSTFTFTLPLA